MKRQDPADSFHASPLSFREGRFSLGGHRFHSRSEAACAIIMELFIPGFTVAPGLTFQIFIGEDKNGNQLSVDFMVNDILFEYHPPRHQRGRYSKSSPRQPRAGKLSHRSNRTRRKHYPDYRKAKSNKETGRLRQHTFQYYHKRRKQIDRNPNLRGTKLIVATCPEEFYEKVLSQFGRDPLPEKEEFLELFRSLQNEVEYLNWPTGKSKQNKKTATSKPIHSKCA